MKFQGAEICLFFWITIWCFSIEVIAVKSSNDFVSSQDSGSSYFFYQESDYPRDCFEVQEQCPSNNSSGVYWIKPDGYLEPFEVFCDNSENSKGWTVIHRRIEGLLSFSRDWESYKSGFGFLYREFWLGNERISAMTNQKNYQLVIEITTSNGSEVRVSYDDFRIGDEFSDFELTNLGRYVGNTDVVTWCSSNVINGSSSDTCLRACEHPDTCQALVNGCTCPDGLLMKGSDCVPKEQCGCYESEGQKVIPEGGFYVNRPCRRKGVCTNGRIIWDETYTCSSNGRCEMRDNIRQCYCNGDYTGDGQRCEIIPKDCKEIYDDGSRESGIYKIKPTNWAGAAFDVYCNMSDGGGWTVFQRRQDGSVNFFLLWDSYKNGFGDFTTEFWLGNDKLYYLTNQKRYEIRVDLVNRDYNAHYGQFDFFRISNEGGNYRLSELGSYSGNVDERSNPDGDFLRYHLNHEFSTPDRDNDAWSYNCADRFRGGWWYNECYRSNLNGDYNAYLDSYFSIFCFHNPGPGYNLKYTEMRIRPV